MNSELDKLIEAVIADGVITDSERCVVLKKAEALGFDKDEVEIYLEGKLHLKIKSIQPQKSNKEGTYNKCPSCGASAQSFTTKCVDCGHEFRNIQANNCVKILDSPTLCVLIF
jgi:DNA-directed RNA polymerase subunit RPC12/RpoP